MNPRRPFLLAATLAIAASAHAQTVLYDAAGGLKVSQYGGWTVFPTSLESFSAGTTLYDTSTINSLQGGFSRLDQTLNRSTGFELGFTMQVNSETHASTNRSGVSVIALTSDLLGIELGFWEDEIWAQSGPGFTKAESGAFSTKSLTNYNLRVMGSTYALYANGGASPIVTGALRDYSSAGLVYVLPNFMFFGDDTTSARGAFSTQRITLGAAAPEPTALWLLGLGLATLAVRARRR